MNEAQTTPTSAINDKGRNNFGFLRLFFAVLVIFSHSPELIDGNRSREILTQIFHTISFGEFAVDGFFLISGFLVTKSFMQSSTRRSYLLKRLARIVPGFAIAFLISLFIAGLLGGGDLSGIPMRENLIAFFTLQQPALPGAFANLPYHDLNGAVWTISYEFRC